LFFAFVDEAAQLAMQEKMIDFAYKNECIE
jgi:hypothetical protein